MMPRRSLAGAAVGWLAVLLLTGCIAGNETESELQPSSISAEVIAVADPVSGTYTGTQTIELGPPPEDATHIRIDIKCLTTGILVLESGDEAVCQNGDGATFIKSSSPLSAGQDYFTVTANDPDIAYEAEVVYENGASVR
jgi:hypothetical protein